MLRRSSLFKNVLPVAVVAATMAWAGAANASIVLDVNGNVSYGIEKKLATDDLGNPNDLLFVTNIYVRFTELDDRLLSIGFSVMNTKNGSNFHQDPFGTNTAPSKALIAIFPSLAFDTFITIGLKSDPGPPNPDTTSPDPDFVMGLTRITGGWFHAVDAGQGNASSYPMNPDGTFWILIAQLTVDNKPGNGVFGSMIVSWQEAIGQGVQTPSGSFDNQVPSPGALALLGLAGLMGAHRRRRR